MGDSLAFATESIARTRAADEKAAVSAGMFAFGIWDDYVAREQQDLRKRLEASYGGTVAGGTNGGAGV